MNVLWENITSIIFVGLYVTTIVWNVVLYFELKETREENVLLKERYSFEAIHKRHFRKLSKWLRKTLKSKEKELSSIKRKYELLCISLWDYTNWIISFKSLIKKIKWNLK